jgi:hypothetical protein
MASFRPALNRFLSATILTSTLLLPGCGSKDDLADLSSSVKPAATTGSATQAELLAAIPKIMAGLEEISSKLDALEVRAADDDLPVPVTATKPTTATTTAPTKPTTTTKPTTAVTTPKPTATAAPKLSAKEKGQQEMKKLLDKVKAAPFIQASIEKVEKNLKTGKVTSNKLTMYTKQPNVVKIDVSYSSSGASGAKVLYKSGEGNKLKIRPGGSLSFMTTELDKTDSRVTSNNGYPLDDNDFFGVVRRFSSGYQAELIGASTLNGKKIHILKITTTGTNALDARVTHEHIGYDPETYGIMLWEMYNEAGAKEPFFRLTLPSLSFPSSLPDSNFQV